MEILQEIGNTARGKMVEMNIRYSFDENDWTQEFNKIKEIFESQKTEGIEDFIQLCNALLEEDEAQIGINYVKVSWPSEKIPDTEWQYW